jgi:hypothetical protein
LRSDAAAIVIFAASTAGANARAINNGMIRTSIARLLVRDIFRRPTADPPAGAFGSMVHAL